MDFVPLDVLGMFAPIAGMSGLTASALTQVIKENRSWAGGLVLFIQAVLGAILGVLILLITSVDTPSLFIGLQYAAAGLFGGLAVAAGWNFASLFKKETPTDEPIQTLEGE